MYYIPGSKKKLKIENWFIVIISDKKQYDWKTNLVPSSDMRNASTCFGWRWSLQVRESQYTMSWRPLTNLRFYSELTIYRYQWNWQRRSSWPPLWPPEGVSSPISSSGPRPCWGSSASWCWTPFQEATNRIVVRNLCSILYELHVYITFATYIIISKNDCFRTFRHSWVVQNYQHGYNYSIASGPLLQ